MTMTFLLSTTAVLMLIVLMVLLFIRIFVSFLMLEGSSVEKFLFILTEPIVSPMRKTLEKSEFFSSIPVDFSMQFTLLIILLVYTFLTF